jgi:23S rRNA (guanosine2251-2'-O)-methyltransferase
MSARADEALLIGIHSVASALSRDPQRVRWVAHAVESRNPRTRELVQKARQLGIDIREESRAVLDRRCDGQRHQDIIAGFEAANLLTEKDVPTMLDAIEGDPLLLVLDGVQDPHNLGACLRTAEAAGAHAVILPRDRSAPLTPVARRAASGAAETLPLILVTNLARVLKQLRARGIWLAGTTDKATDDIWQQDLTGPLALVMGSEGKGMRRLTTELCDYRLRIPMAGAVSSLNVSVATAVCLFEIVRQRRSST